MSQLLPGPRPGPGSDSILEAGHPQLLELQQRQLQPGVQRMQGLACLREASGTSDLRHLVRTVATSGLVAFRLAGKKPSSKKRPLSAVDDVASTDFTVRLYEIHEVSSQTPESEAVQSISVSFHLSSEIPLIRMAVFSQSDRRDEKLSEKITKNMLQWFPSESGIEYVFNTNEGQVGPEGFSMLQDIFAAGAVYGSDKHYATAGFTVKEDVMAASLAERGWLVHTRSKQGHVAVQLSSACISERVVLTASRQVFQPRVGVSPAYDKIHLKQGIRPSQLEAFFFMQQQGWLRSSWSSSQNTRSRRMGKLKDAFYEEGS